MRKEQLAYISIALLLILAFSMFVTPAFAFVNPNGTQNSNYELYGPHLNEILVSEYGTPQDEFTAQYNGGGTPGIDVGDWPLTPSWISTFSSDPNVMVLNAGGQNSYYVIDFNQDPNEYIVPTTRPNYKNPVWNGPISGDTAYPNGIPPITTNVYFRLACQYLFDRATYATDLGISGTNIYTPIPAYMSLTTPDWIWGGAISSPYNTFSAADALAALYAGHIYNYTNPSSPSTSPSAWYWDYQNIGPHVPTATELAAAVLKMTYRMDVERYDAGVMLSTELTSFGFTWATGGLYPTDPLEVSGGTNYEVVMLVKDYLITTLGWGSVGPQPWYLYSGYNGVNFWDTPSSSCPNTADLNDVVINNESYWIMNAPNISVAYEACIAFQERFQEIAAEIPLYSPTSYMAVSKTYIGTEDSYGGQSWVGMANSPSIGPDGWFTFLNAYAGNSLYGTSANPEVMRWGWSVESYPEHLNPMYSEWVWDYDILGEIYDSPGYLDPMNLVTWHGDLIENWTVGTWRDPVTNVVKSEVTMTLRPDLYWSDGQPMTMADVIFSIVDLGPLLVSEGLPPPWWWPTAETIQSVIVKDPYTVSLLFNVQSTWAEGWALGGFYIIPEHVWKPIITGFPKTNPSTFAPDPNMVGSGPFRYVSYASTGLTLVMTANSPGSTVTTDRSGAVPTTSTYGYHNYYPVALYVNTLAGTGPGGSWPDYAVRIPINLATDTVNIPIEVTLFSKLSNSSGTFTALTGVKTVTFTYPNGTVDNLAISTPETLPGNPSPENPVAPNVETFIVPNVGIGLSTVFVSFTINGPATVPDLGATTQANPWIGDLNATLRIYVTSPYDVAGSNFIKDIGMVLGTLTDGTGVATGSPITLYYGANTITITTAGTFTVSLLPGVGGTATHGTATLTGSPVTLTMGGTTTLTTTGTGTIIVSLTYDPASELPTPDFVVDGKDIVAAALAFGSYPGSPRWNSVADVNHDNVVDGKDIALMAIHFGW